MSKFLDLGLGISIINWYYSLSYFLMWCVALRLTTDDDNEPFVWLTVYMGNVFLNVFLFVGLRKRDRLAVIIWFSLTLLWFLPKLYDHKRGCRLDARGSTYRIVNIVMESYVIISFAVMMLVYSHLPKKLPKTEQRSRYKTYADTPDIQMVDLSSKVAAIAPLATEEVFTDEEAECLPGSSKQQVFEFHRAAGDD
ncbi:uncharacterized protein LOC115760899 [Drosophila novamexicana]|uniref:uncharacterized protein LOC115760899 n=1 Tax=Drosophila novamexicana TaxID=47314 RepID=UPI0011E5F2A1|nr:uncharacterized protein LOC115760899 [Drosophila novamexicana]